MLVFPEAIGWNGDMENRVLESIREWLRRESVSFREVQHAPTYTSEESAKARGEEVRVGGKAILMKTDQVFRLFVLSAALRIDSAAIKQHFQIKKLRFASPDELREQTGLVPGSVPPFGAPILPFELFVDPSVFAQERIAFNAGSLTDSIILSTEDYRRLAKPTVFPFALVERQES
jgi:Ala-tRNA(Pro) deacylase